MSILERGTILVTGGAGFLGSALVWALNQRGFDRILIADFLGHSEKWRNLAPLRFVDYLEADDLLRAVDSDAGKLRDIGSVFHLGACSSTTETDAAYLIRNNFQYTATLAEWALRHQNRFVYASSAATYGALESGLSESIELATLRPLNMYGYSKQLFDQHAARHGYLDRIVGLKYFNVFGPNEQHKGDMRSMVLKAFEQIRQSGRVKLFKSYRPAFKDGEQRRDFVYVKDAIDMTLHLAESTQGRSGLGGGLFNVGSGRAHTWIELATAVFEAMAQPVAIDFIEMPDAIRANYQYSTVATLTRLRESGYAHEPTPLREAVADYVREYLLPGRRLGDEVRIR
jgi:ADP-L-glycero-D-manno-heptose 6-epimerase